MADIEYEVESITDKRQENGRTEYYVKWKGYLACESTWEPLEHLTNAQQAIERYEEKSRRESSSTPAPERKASEKMREIRLPKQRKWPRRIRSTRAAGTKQLTVSLPRLSGFQRELMPERIVCSIDDGVSTRFLMKWLFEDEGEIVAGDEAWANCPHLITDFFHPHKFSPRPDSRPPFRV